MALGRALWRAQLSDRWRPRIRSGAGGDAGLERAVPAGVSALVSTLYKGAGVPLFFYNGVG